MDSPTFLGVSHNNWAFINSFAAWFAAIGTIGAVIVSLYLASRRQKARAKVRVGSRIIVEEGGKGPYPEYLMFSIANSGDMPITINQIGWKVGLFKKRAAIQLIDNTLSSELPIELKHGQEAKWFTPIKRVDRPWIKNFCEYMMMPKYRTSCFTLRAEFYSSIGQTFRVKPESYLIGMFRDECVRLSKNQN